MAIESIGRSAVGSGFQLLKPENGLGSTRTPDEGFAKEMGRVIAEANGEQMAASNAIRDLLVDGRGTIHDAMIAVNNAEGSFRLLMELRNRLIEGVNTLLETRL